jgi:hypothetical protein
MPKPILCLSEPLRQFADAFRPCFSPRQWQYFVIVLLGLVECEERRTLSGLKRTVADGVSVSGLSRFLSRWRWSAESVATTWLARFRQQMVAPVQAEHAHQRAERVHRRGRPKTTVVTGYVSLDDSVHIKPKGRTMGGLGHHYASTEKRQVTGHCLFTGVYSLLGRRCPLPAQLYRQRAVCEREGVPFRSKIDLAVETIQQFMPVPDTHTHVLIDSWYHCRRVRRTATSRGWNVSGALKSNRMLRQIGTDGTRRWLSLADYAASLKADEWVEATWPTHSGSSRVYVHTVRTWVRKLGPTHVLLTRLSPEAPLAQTRYWGSTLLTADAQTVLNALAVRWEVEVLFEDSKDLLGSDHYQLMSATAIVRFWTVVACLACFLDEQRAVLQAAAPDATISRGDARRALQADHRRNLLRWLEVQFRAGLSADELFERLAA